MLRTRDAHASLVRRRCSSPASVAGVLFWRLLPERLFDDPRVLRARGARRHAALRAHRQRRAVALSRRAARCRVKFRRALLVFEDKRFESHSGVDGARDRARAAPQCARRPRGERRQHADHAAGATRRAAASSATLATKVGEALLALRIEAVATTRRRSSRCTPAHAPFGGNVVGLEAASWRYFGRDPHSLSWAEAATLAVLPNNPALVHLSRNRERLQAKRDFAAAPPARGRRSHGARSRPGAERAAGRRAARAARSRAASARYAARAGSRRGTAS